MGLKGWQCLYTSNLQNGVDNIADIIKQSRKNNDSNNITGILIFDGAHFCQFLEGEIATLQQLQKKIETDNRHTDFKILYENPFAITKEKKRLFANFSIAYSTKDNDLMPLLNLKGASALSYFLQLLPRLDIDPQ